MREWKPLHPNKIYKRLLDFQNYLDSIKELHMGYPYNFNSFNLNNINNINNLNNLNNVDVNHLERSKSHNYLTKELNKLYDQDIDLCVDRLLKSFFNYTINNLGDPYIESNYSLHSRDFEQEIIQIFANLWNMSPLDEHWGYVSSCGTEGNLQALLMAREAMGHSALLLASKDSHYSIRKGAKMFNIELKEIDSKWNGVIDLNHFEKVVYEINSDNIGNKIGNKTGNKTVVKGGSNKKSFTKSLKRLIDFNKDERTTSCDYKRKLIINCNMGTTMMGAIDDLNGMISILKRYGYKREEYFIHLDGALSGLMLPFLSDLFKDLDYDLDLDFSKNEVDTMTVSAHKFLGCPQPAGIILSKKTSVERISNEIEYLNSTDTTIGGSRNGHTSLYIWKELMYKGFEGIQNDVINSIQKSIWLYNQIKRLGISTMLNAFSNTVVFTKPENERGLYFIRKWQLACNCGTTHVVIMPNHKKRRLMEFLDDLKMVFNQIDNDNDNESANTGLNGKEEFYYFNGTEEVFLSELEAEDEMNIQNFKYTRRFRNWDDIGSADPLLRI